MKLNYEERLRRELRRIFEAFRIVSPTSFLFRGKTVGTVRSSTPLLSGIPAPLNPLVANLQQYLYQHCYSSRLDGRAKSSSPPTDNEDKFAVKLAEANLSRARWDSGWQIERVEPSGQIWSHKHGIHRLFWPGEFVNYETPGIPVRPGMLVNVFFAKESVALQPGSYFVFGETTLGNENYDLVRFYWNLRPNGAFPLIRGLTQQLNRFQVPFRFKCPIRREFFTRCDSAVLYVNKRFYRIVCELLIALHETLEPHLRPHAPLFTLPLMSGLSMAEDPGNGESFGTSRCRIVAEGIWRAYEHRRQGKARMEEIAAQFQRYGLLLERAYLNAGSVNQYDVWGI